MLFSGHFSAPSFLDTLLFYWIFQLKKFPALPQVKKTEFTKSKNADSGECKFSTQPHDHITE